MLDRLRKSVCCFAITALLAGCASDRGDDFLAEGRKLMQQGNPGGAVVLFKNALEKNPSDYTLHLELGRAYHKLGKYDLADVELQKCYRQKPDDPELNLALGELYVARNKPDLALEHLGKFEAASGATAASRELSGLAYHQAGRAVEARQALEQSFALEPGRLSARLALSRFHLYRGEVAAARNVIDKALEVAPDNGEALTLKGDLLLRKGEDAEALEVFRRVTAGNPYDEYARYMVGALLLQSGKDAEAAAAAAAMRADFKDSALLLMLEGMLASKRQDYAEAASLFQRSVAMRPSVDGYFKLGVALFAKGDAESAVSQFRMVLDATPEHTAARRMVATILLGQRRVDEAMTEARKVLEINPGDAPAHLLLANAYLAKGDRQNAETEFEASLARDPGQLNALLQVSALRQADGRMDEALEDLRLAVVANPDNIIARNAIYAFHLGRGELDKAEKVVREGLNGTAQDAVLYTMLVPLYGGERDEAKALDAIAKAHAADPKFADAYLMGLRLHAGAGRTEQALAESDAYLALVPDSPGFLVASGAMLDLLGRTDEADARFAKALEGKDPRVVLVVANREAAAGRTEKSRQILEAALAQNDVESIREALAVLLVRENKADEALALYSKIEAARPRDALLGRYRLLTFMGRHQEAVDVARKLGQRDTSSPLAPILAASAYERMQQRDLGLQELETAYRQTSAPELLVAMGGLSERGGDFAKAETYYRADLKANPDDVSGLMALATLHMRRNEVAQAIPLYERVLRLFPENVIAMNNLAMAYVQKGGHQRKALHLALQAYTRSPESVDVLDTLGTCLMVNDRADEATRAFGRAVATAPANPTLRYRLAEAHYKAGRKDKAAEEARKALESNDFPESAKARELLRKSGN